MICVAARARRTLIEIGKVLPFFICFIVLISYVECIYALLYNDIVYYKEYSVANKPISNTIAEYFEYDYGIVTICFVLSFAIETCKMNKISVIFLASHLIFKRYIADVELCQNTIIAICVINIAITSYLVFKGAKIAINS